MQKLYRTELRRLGTVVITKLLMFYMNPTCWRNVRLYTVFPCVSTFFLYSQVTGVEQNMQPSSCFDSSLSSQVDSPVTSKNQRCLRMFFNMFPVTPKNLTFCLVICFQASKIITAQVMIPSHFRFCFTLQASKIIKLYQKSSQLR